MLISSPERFVTLSVGGSEVCGLTALGQAYCWGGGAYIMGNGPTAPLPSAAAALAAGGMTFTRLAVGYGFGCGIATAGGAYCWGVNNWGQLGTTAPNETCYGFACRTTPTPVSGGGALVDVSAGGEYACGLDAAGAAWCWGHNNYGQLGVGTPPNQNDAHTTPVAVSGGMSFRTVEAGQSGTCAITASDVAYCWGENLAAGTYNATPAAVAGLPAVHSLTMGSAHACGATTTGAFWCWGNNLWGQLGNGQTSQYYVPPFQTAWPPLASP